jgi:hypothetical protein
LTATVSAAARRRNVATSLRRHGGVAARSTMSIEGVMLIFDDR